MEDTYIIWATLVIILIVAIVSKIAPASKCNRQSETEVRNTSATAETVVRHLQSRIRTEANNRSARRTTAAASNSHKRFTSTPTIAGFETKSTARTSSNHSDTPEPASSEKCGENTKLKQRFNLRDAIIYSEIMKPKFED